MRDGRRQRPGPDHHPAPHHGGRIPIPAQLMHPGDMHVPDATGMVDVAPFRGRPLRMLMKGARLLFSCDMPCLHTLIELGALSIATDGVVGRYRFLMIDPAWTLRILYERWYADWTPGSFKRSDEYKRMRHVCRIPASEPPRRKELDAAFEIQFQTGAFGRGDMLAHFPMVPETEKMVTAEMSARLRRRLARDGGA